MLIRRIQAQDVPDFLALWTQVFAEGAFLAKRPPPENKVLQVVERVVKDQIPNFVAIDGLELVGAVEVFPGSMCGFNDDNAERRGYLGIQLAQRYRGKGIGRKLMQAAIDDARSYGFEVIELTVFQSNIAAIELYEKLGFKHTGYGKSIELPVGLATTEQHMALSLKF
mgnify:CR=1 FL=1